VKRPIHEDKREERIIQRWLDYTGLSAEQAREYFHLMEKGI
jgi:hypothetical protein